MKRIISKRTKKSTPKGKEMHAHSGEKGMQLDRKNYILQDVCNQEFFMK